MGKNKPRWCVRLEAERTAGKNKSILAWYRRERQSCRTGAADEADEGAFPGVQIRVLGVYEHCQSQGCRHDRVPFRRQK